MPARRQFEHAVQNPLRGVDLRHAGNAFSLPSREYNVMMFVS